MIDEAVEAALIRKVETLDRKLATCEKNQRALEAEVEAGERTIDELEDQTSDFHREFALERSDHLEDLTQAVRDVELGVLDFGELVELARNGRR